MLSALLLAALVGASIATAVLFVPVNGHHRGAGVWPWTRRLILALVGTGTLAWWCGSPSGP